MEQRDQQLAQGLAEIYSKLNLIFHGILALPLIAFVWLYLESNADSLHSALQDESTIDIISFALPVLTIGVIIGAFMIFKAGVKSIATDDDMPKRVQAYFQKSVMLYAMLEVGLILNLVGFYLAQQNIFLAMYIIVLIFFSLNKPTFKRISKHLNITGTDRAFLIDCRRIARGEEKEKGNHARL